MRYPILTVTKCTELADQLAEGLQPAVDSNVDWLGEGDEWASTQVAAAADEIFSGAREWTDPDRDRYEGKMSPLLYAALDSVPPEVLDDRGFWRYLGLKFFWEFIAWREEGPFSKGNQVKYVNAISATESVLTRMYLRAQAVGGPDHADLAGAIPQSTDFWRSHVLRVRTGSAPPIARAFADHQLHSRLPTDSLRDVARSVNRLWTNIVLHTYDDDDARRIIETIWPAPEAQ